MIFTNSPVVPFQKGTQFQRADRKLITSPCTLTKYLRTIDRLKGDDLLSNELIQPLNYVKRIWDSCVQDTSNTTEEMQKLEQYFKELDKLDSWQEKFVKLTKDGYNVLFTVEMDRVGLLSSVIHLDSPKFEFSRPLLPEDATVLLNYYLNLIELFKKEDSSKLAEEIIEFETWMSTNSTSAGEKQTKSLNSVRMSMGQMNRITKMEWQQLMSQLVTRFNYTENERITVDDLEYLKNFRKIVESKSESFLSNYFKLAVLQQSCFFLGQECRKWHLKVIKSVKNFDEKDEDVQVQRKCFEAMQKLELEDLLFRAYDTNWQPKWTVDEVVQVKNLTRNLATEFENQINNFSWMDNETKVKAIDHATYDRFEVRTPNYLDFRSELEEKYLEAPHINSTEKVAIFDYFKDLLEFSKRLDFQIRPRVKMQKWPISLFSATPFMAPEVGNLYVTDFFVKGPFVSPDLPEQIKFGYFASLLAHQMTHSFDYTAERGHKMYFSTQLWSNWTSEQFYSKMKCLVDAYDEQDGPVKIDGNLTLNENLADLLSVKVAYETFKNNSWPGSPEVTEFPDLLKDMANDKLFFLSYANTQCANEIKEVPVKEKFRPPKKYRVNVPLAHVEQFARAFECKAGSKMNPVKKCQII